MLNEFLWLILLVFNFLAIMFAFRLWGKTGLFVWMAISVIVANIQVTKTVILFGLEATLGNIVYATGFLATDILSEFYGKKYAQKAVWIGFFSLISMTVMMQAAIVFTPSPADYVQEGLLTVFSIMPRITAASLAAYLLSNFHDVWAFEFWKKRYPERLWLRNNFSTMVSQLIDSVVFTAGAFWGVYEGAVFLQVLLTTYLLKFIVAACDTPFIYLARRWVNAGLIKEL